jgi:hypothetical protein
MNSYAQTRLILFLSKFCQTVYCFVMIFCGDTSGIEGDLLKKSPPTPLFQRGELANAVC